MKRHSLALSLLSLSAITTMPASACTVINAAPAVLSQPGRYCLAADLAFPEVTGNAITITSDDVSLDCRGHKINPGVSLGANPGSEVIIMMNDTTLAVGVAAMNRSNTTIRNCQIEGFHSGIRINEDGTLARRPTGTVVESNRVIGNSQTGILVATNGSIVRDNEVRSIGDNRLAQPAVGIRVRGSVDVQRNLVEDVRDATNAVTGAFGIFATDGNGGVIENNRVVGISGGLSRVGIASYAPGGTIIRNNSLNNYYPAKSTYDVAYACTGGRTLLEGNTSYGFAQGQAACQQIGTNTLVAGTPTPFPDPQDQAASK